MSSIELWPKQQEVFEFAKDLKEAALLCEQRTGKTFITLKLLETRVEDAGGDFCGLLVCILNNKESTWVKYLTQYLPQLSVTTNWEEFKKLKGPRLLLAHFEALPGLIRKLVKYRKFNWAGVDEAHRLYNPGSKQSRAMARMSWVEWKLILTGTPMEKQPTDFFGQFKFLAPHVLGTNKGEFEEEWLDWKKIDLGGPGAPRPGGPAYKEKLMLQRILKNKAKFREDRLDEFVELLSPYCIRIEKSDVGILPPEIRPVSVAMPKWHISRYRHLESKSWVELPGATELMATMPATKNMKLRQMASGFVYDEEGGLHWLSSRKLNKAIQLFESLPKPVVLFSSFVPELLRLHRRLEELGYDVGLVYGKTPKKKRPGIWAAFQGAQLDAVVCQISAGGVGVDLWKANHGIVTSMSYSSIIWDQAKARMDSRDKSVPATLHVLLAENTIDEDLYDLIELKGLTTKSVLSHLKRRQTWPKKKPLLPLLRKKRRNTTSATSLKISANRRPRSGSCSASRTSKRKVASGVGTKNRTTTRP